MKFFRWFVQSLRRELEFAGGCRNAERIAENLPKYADKDDSACGAIAEKRRQNINGTANRRLGYRHSERLRRLRALLLTNDKPIQINLSIIWFYYQFLR